LIFPPLSTYKTLKFIPFNNIDEHKILASALIKMGLGRLDAQLPIEHSHYGGSNDFVNKLIHLFDTFGGDLNRVQVPPEEYMLASVRRLAAIFHTLNCVTSEDVYELLYTFFEYIHNPCLGYFHFDKAESISPYMVGEPEEYGDPSSIPFCLPQGQGEFTARSDRVFHMDNREASSLSIYSKGLGEIIYPHWLCYHSFPHNIVRVYRSELTTTKPVSSESKLVFEDHSGHIISVMDRYRTYGAVILNHFKGKLTNVISS
jgi:hypothetical protein